MVTGLFQNLKWSMPLSLSAIAKKDFLSTPSTRAISKYLFFYLIAAGFNTALIPIRSGRRGCVFSFKSYRQFSGICPDVKTGNLYRLKAPPLFDPTFLFLRSIIC